MTENSLGHHRHFPLATDSEDIRRTSLRAHPADHYRLRSAGIPNQNQDIATCGCLPPTKGIATVFLINARQFASATAHWVRQHPKCTVFHFATTSALSIALQSGLHPKKVPKCYLCFPRLPKILQWNFPMKKQIYLSSKFKMNLNFGGSLLKNSHAKIVRPISTKESMHVVLKSSRANGSLSMLNHKHSKFVSRTIHFQAKKFLIHIHNFANVGNHIHILIKVNNRECFKNFLRAIAGLIAKYILGRKRSGKEKFWDQRPFSRIVFWKKDFIGVQKYVIQNFNEAMGFIPYLPRKKPPKTSIPKLIHSKLK